MDTGRGYTRGFVPAGVGGYGYGLRFQTRAQPAYPNRVPAGFGADGRDGTTGADHLAALRTKLFGNCLIIATCFCSHDREVMSMARAEIISKVASGHSPRCGHVTWVEFAVVNGAKRKSVEARSDPGYRQQALQRRERVQRYRSWRRLPSGMNERVRVWSAGCRLEALHEGMMVSWPRLWRESSSRSGLYMRDGMRAEVPDVAQRERVARCMKPSLAGRPKME
ncbi:hypothetical protein C8J57DRAFT_1257552 [Mycena rebaudengoi]|nr:hypothetical protein C8J57DRAFT_1257552 [Mycena rebaudengoi]